MSQRCILDPLTTVYKEEYVQFRKEVDASTVSTLPRYTIKNADNKKIEIDFW
jgi:hypothetical protein